MNVEQLFLLFIVYSFLGWLIEVTNALIVEHKFVNRGFMIGPYCPIYGVGALIITFALTRYQDDLIVLFVMSMVLCCILEYFTSYIMEKIFKTRWWDYSNHKFNINGRICLDVAALFGILGVLVVSVLNPFFTGILTLIPGVIVTILFLVLLIFFLLDFAVSFKIITNIKTLNLNNVKDSTEEITQIVKNTLLNNTILNRRIIKAFPDLKTSNIWLKKRLEKMKQKLEDKIERNF